MKIQQIKRLRSSEIVRSVHAGGNLNNDGQAGVVTRNSNNGLGNSNTNNGSQLSYLHLYESKTKPYLLVEHKNLKQGYSSSMQGISLKVAKTPKKVGNIYHKLYDLDNMKMAFKNAMKGKNHYNEVINIKANIGLYIEDLHNLLKNRKFQNGKYEIFEKVSGNKTRIIYKLPFYPDRVVHHCILQVIGEVWIKSLITDTYSTIPKRGVHSCANKLKKVINKDEVKYCLKLDVKKYYPSIDNNILKIIIRKKIKDKYLLELLDNIIDSEKGIPIGNYISQWFGNLYLNYFDHYVKNELKIKHYFRYCDDLVLLGDDKNKLRDDFFKIEEYLNNNLKLKVKENHQIFPISRGIDFVGFRFFKGYTLVRKRIIKKLKQKLNNPLSKSSYFGWIVHADTYRFRQKYFTEGYAKRCKV